MDCFDQEDALSDIYWDKRAMIAFRSEQLFKLEFVSFFLIRIFDINEDGFVSKKEFGWMTSSKIIGLREIERVFKVFLKKNFTIG